MNAAEIAEMCYDTFPHGVAALAYMLEHGVRGFSIVGGDMDRTKVTADLLCSSMTHGHHTRPDESQVEDMEETFREIGQILRPEN